MSTEASTHCVVQTTLPSEAQAAELARTIVLARLGACVQVLAIRSFYVWQERAHDEAEWLLAIKTRCALYPQLEAWLLKHHPYDTPEIICLPITAGSTAYLDWVDANTA
ncbi:MAG: divalent-cation tolerance protein CutA [Hylemonella sp.]